MAVSKGILKNFGLKLLSLILAVGTWFYINTELTKIKNEEERAIFSMVHYDVVSKKLPIQITIVGKTQPEFTIVTKGITVTPDSCIVIGPKIILDQVEVARTVPIDITEFTQDVNKDLTLAPIAEGLELKNYFVKVHIPIAKKEESEKTVK